MASQHRIRVEKRVDEGSLEAMTWDWLRREYGPCLGELVVQTMTRLYSHRALRANGQPHEAARQNGWAYFFSLIGDTDPVQPTQSLPPTESTLTVEPVQNGHSEPDELDPMDLGFELTEDYGAK